MANDPDYCRPRHLKIIEEHLLSLYRGEITRLLLHCPPRHGKSEVMSKYFPAWWLIRRPRDHVILSSYEATFAASWGRKVKSLVEKFGPHFGVKISKDAAKGHDWETNHGGGMVTAGVGGPITGRGANLAILDDPIKNAEEALSPTYRDKIEQWFNSTLYPRLEPGGVIAVMHTRWHQDDLAGRLLDAEDPWVTINMPAIDEQGKALWSDRFPIDKLEQIKRQVGSFWFASQWQGEPMVEGGNIIQRSWLQYYTTPLSNFDRLIQSWDTAFKEGDDTSYVVGQVWGKLGADYYLLDQVRDRANFTETLDMIRGLSRKWPGARAKVIEERANGAAVISQLKRELSGLVDWQPDSSKEARARAVEPFFEAGNVHLPREAEWISDYVEELVNFPSAKHDDQVDATTQALQYFTEKSGKISFVGPSSTTRTKSKRREERMPR